MGSVLNPARPAGGPAKDLVQPVLQPPILTYPLPVSSWGPRTVVTEQMGQGTRLRAVVRQLRATTSEAPGIAHHGHEF